jgi:hypothetical protein
LATDVQWHLFQFELLITGGNIQITYAVQVHLQQDSGLNIAHKAEQPSA